MNVYVVPIVLKSQEFFFHEVLDHLQKIKLPCDEEKTSIFHLISGKREQLMYTLVSSARMQPHRVGSTHLVRQCSRKGIISVEGMVNSERNGILQKSEASPWNNSGPQQDYLNWCDQL